MDCGTIYTSFPSSHAYTSVELSFDKWSSKDKEEEWGKKRISKAHRVVAFQKCPLSLSFQLVGIPQNPMSINHTSFPTRLACYLLFTNVTRARCVLIPGSKHRLSPFQKSFALWGHCWEVVRSPELIFPWIQRSIGDGSPGLSPGLCNSEHN